MRHDMFDEAADIIRRLLDGETLNVEGTRFAEAAGRPTPSIGQQPICWDPDRDTAVRRAHEQFRWFSGGWKVNSELPGTAGFAAATQYVRPSGVAESIPCGPDTAAHVEAPRPWLTAG